jgi:hypothetical protein
MEPPEKIEGLCRAFVAGLKAVLGDNLAGVYLYGAVAFPETVDTGDVDGHVILAGPLSEHEKAGLETLHASLARDYPPLGADLDVHYLLLADTRTLAPPPHQLRAGVFDTAWALHCAHIRAGRCIPLYGPDPLQVYPTPAWPDLEAALRGELRYVEEKLEDYPAYCVLNLCRLVYSFQACDVVISKAGAATWAWDALPGWRPLIAAAQRSYAGRAAAQDGALLRSGVPALFRQASHHIGQAAAAAGARLEAG